MEDTNIFESELEELKQEARSKGANDDDDAKFFSSRIHDMEEWLQERHNELDGLQDKNVDSSTTINYDNVAIDISNAKNGEAMDIDTRKKRTLKERDEEAAQEALMLLSSSPPTAAAAAAGGDTGATTSSTMVAVPRTRQQRFKYTRAFKPQAPSFVYHGTEKIDFLPDDDDDELLLNNNLGQPATKRKNIRLLKE